MNQFVILIAFFFFNRAPHPYCSCLPLTIEEQTDSAEIIFKGEVISIDTLLTIQKTINYENDSSKTEDLRPIEMIRVNLKVHQLLKGTLNLDTISIYTTWKCCMCGFPFETNGTYLVFANQELISISNERTIIWDHRRIVNTTQKPASVFFTSICSGTEGFRPETMDVIKIHLAHRKNSR